MPGATNASYPAQLTINLFGILELSGAGPMVLKTRKEQWLLGLLALNLGKPVDRAWLSTALWPDAETGMARYYLRRALSDLNNDLGDYRRLIQSESYRTICLEREGVVCDLTEFDQLLYNGDIASLKQAVSLYRGPLLVECPEEWAIPARVLREQQYALALDALAASALESGAWLQAAGFARQLIASDAFNESAYRTLMHALSNSGNVPEAIKAYRDLRLLLHGELNTQPDAETQALFEILRERHTLPQHSEPIRSKARAVDSGCSTFANPQHTPTQFKPLPRPLTTLFGREDARLEVVSLLNSTKLVTLTGPGGIGKTRLALDVAQHQNAIYTDGILFVDLASVSEPTMLPIVMAEAAGISEQVGVELSEAIVKNLAECRSLVILDNCEHLIDACALQVHKLIQAVPFLKVIATSRQPLNISGERVFQVPTLEIPPAIGVGDAGAVSKPTVDTVLDYSSVQLFVQRAREANSTFRVTQVNLASIANICRRLDGIALAIELAAVRTRSLSPEQIESRLNDRFSLLTTGSRVAMPRQQTLRALVDWSYVLLTEDEKKLLAYLAEFTGGWTLEAAEQVCSSQPPDFDSSHSPSIGEFTRNELYPSLKREAIMDLVSALVDRSLIVMERVGDSVRYRMLDTIREYAGEKLRALPEHRGLVRNFATYLNHRLWNSWTAPIEQGVAWVAAEYANIRSALEITLLDPDGGELAASLACGLERFWHVRSYFIHGMHYLRRAYEHKGIQQNTELHARTVLCLANMSRLVNELDEAEKLFNIVLDLLEQLKNYSQIARALSALAYVYILKGDLEAALVVCLRAVELVTRLGNKYSEANVRSRLEYIYREMGDLDAAYSNSLKAIELSIETGQPRVEFEARYGLGQVHLARGEYSEALSCFAATLKHHQSTGSKGGISEAHTGIALVAMKIGQYERARASLHESLNLALEIDFRVGILKCIEESANLRNLLGFNEEAALLCGWCAAERMRLRLAPPGSGFTRTSAAIAEGIGEARFRALVLQGGSMDLNSAAQIALSE